jgi:hypothetical protein
MYLTFFETQIKEAFFSVPAACSSLRPPARQSNKAEGSCFPFAHIGLLPL